jgi:KamA family protein
MKNNSTASATIYVPATTYVRKDIPLIFERLNISDPYLKERMAVACIYPFKATQHSLNLIDWDNYESDSVFHLVFPQPEMLSAEEIAKLIEAEKNDDLEKVVQAIRQTKNPNPANQELNRPVLTYPNGRKIIIEGMQHKYIQTTLVFPKPAQVCFSNCQYCFRAPQLWGSEDMFVEESPAVMLDYFKYHNEVTDVLFTGGDPAKMTAEQLSEYIDPLLGPDYEHIQNIRMGTKALTFLPQRFLSMPDSDDFIMLLEKAVKSGKSVNIMAHFSSLNELAHPDTEKAIKRIRETGATIRSQTPLMKHINADADVLAAKWKKEVKLGVVPYYLFIARDTGPQEYYEVSLADAYTIYSEAREKVSGLCHTLRGPSMSASPGKVAVIGMPVIKGEKVFALKFLQARNFKWQEELFFAKYDPKAFWLDDLKPAFGEKEFFYEAELKQIYTNIKASM